MFSTARIANSESSFDVDCRRLFQHYQQMKRKLLQAARMKLHLFLTVLCCREKQVPVNPEFSWGAKERVGRIVREV